MFLQLESALLRSARQILHPLSAAQNGLDGAPSLAEREIPDIQAVLRSGMNMIQFRDLTVSTLSSLQAHLRQPSAF